MRAFLKFLINLALICGVLWLVARFTTLDDKFISRFKNSGATSTTISQNVCTTPWWVMIPQGSSIFAYAEQNPVDGNCKEEMRTCDGGQLQGTYTYPSCNGITQSGSANALISWSAIPAQGNSCTTPWGQTIAHGNYIVSYESPSSCKFQRRMCVDGQLLGKFMYNYCILPYMNANGNIGNQYGGDNLNGWIATYDSPYSVDNAQTFSNTINDGSPYANGSRQYTPVNYGGNNANTQLPNDYWNQNNNGNVSVVRSWNDNKKNPLATHGTSNYTPPKSRNYNNYDLTQKWCNTPWGTYVDHGQYVIAYKASQAKKWGSCEYERRTCFYGKLNGSFSKPSCGTASSSSRQYGNQWYDNYYRTNTTSTTSTNRSCRTPWGTTVRHGEYIRAYKYASAPWSDGCEGEVRYCHNGILDGWYTNRSCNLVQPQYQGCYGRQCGSNNWGNSCSTPRWNTISNGQSVVAYSKINGSCYSETRTCSNGWLQWSYSLQYCNNDNNNRNYQSCALPRWGSISHGQSVEAYSSTGSPCYKEIRWCYNGILNGSYGYSYCSQYNNPTTPTTDTYGNWESVGYRDSMPNNEDTCHANASAAFSCQTQDATTCIDYRKVANDCCVAGRATYEKRTVTCVR